MKMEVHTSDSVFKCPGSSHKIHLNSIGHARNQGTMKPPIPGMKNSHFTCLPISGLESHEIMYPGYGLFFPGWSKTSRRTRTRPGNVVPGASWTLSAPDNEESRSRVRTRPGKALMHIPASDQAFSGSINIGYDNLVHENGDQVTENLPLKKRKMESAFPSTAGISNPKRPFANEPAIIQGASFSTSGKSPRTQIPGPSKNHVCDICDRAFKSYQALGGHKSHHNNKAHEIRSTFEDRDALTTAVHVERAEGRCCGPVHRCPFCDKVFSKGQALGGHKRHYGRARYAGPTGFSFDLNELPPEWVPEEMGARTSG